MIGPLIVVGPGASAQLSPCIKAAFVILDNQLCCTAKVTRSCRFAEEPQVPAPPHEGSRWAPGPSARQSPALDYWNSLLAGLPASGNKPLQRIQKAAAHLVFKLSKFPHVTSLFRPLAPCRSSQIQAHSFKTMVPMVLAYKAVNGTAPAYIQALVRPHTQAIVRAWHLFLWTYLLCRRWCIQYILDILFKKKRLEEILEIYLATQIKRLDPFVV